MKATLVIFVFLFSGQSIFPQSVRLVLNQFGSCYYIADVLLGNDIAEIDCQSFVEFENIDSVSMFWQYDSTVNVEIVRPGEKIIVGDESKVSSNWVIKMNSYIYSPKLVGRIYVHFDKKIMPDLFFYSYVLYKEKTEGSYLYTEPGDITYDLSLSYRSWVDDYAYKGVVKDVDQDVEYSLYNFPNPFFKETKIKFSLPEKSKVSVYLYSETGEIADIILDSKDCLAGVNYIDYRPKSDMKLGGYFCRLVVNEQQVITRKIFLIK